MDGPTHGLAGLNDRSVDQESLVVRQDDLIVLHQLACATGPPGIGRLNAALAVIDPPPIIARKPGAVGRPGQEICQHVGHACTP